VVGKLGVRGFLVCLWGALGGFKVFVERVSFRI